MADNRTGYGLRSMDGGLLYENNAAGFMGRMEAAIRDGVDLTGLDARGQDLRNGNLDGLEISGACFRDCNLSHANLSEASFYNCIFDDSLLFDACLCYSTFERCHFLDAQFGMTDLSETRLINCRFSGYSLLLSSLARVSSLSHSVYLHDATPVSMSRAPCVITGLKNILAFFDDKMLVGSDLYDLEFTSEDKTNISRVS